MSDTRFLRVLIACPRCHLQHDASNVASGSRFHCDCGEVLTVATSAGHDAAVVRCSSCAAPREGTASACRFCGSDFTLHEQDMHTICPACATRISDQARFCHSCATPISPQAIAGEASDRCCPACGEDRTLHSRPIDGERVSILECHQCAGIWIGHEVFRHLEETSLSKEIAWNPSRPDTPLSGLDLPAKGTPLYRRCTECDQLMNRTNYGRRSGVIVDICRDHGIWFDHGELARILKWIREGHWTAAKRQKILEDAELAAARKVAATPVRRTASLPAYGAGPTTLGRVLASVVEVLFSR